MTAKNAIKPVLVIEDSPEDFEVLERAFAKAEILLPLYRCRDGDDALAFLFRSGRYADDPYVTRPALILMDLNMPGTDGAEVLKRVKADPALKSIPAVVLSTSRSLQDINESYLSGANSYIQKPVDMAGYIRMAQMLKTYWFECSILPD